jgi:uncharacterized protein (DUF1330 family)
MLHTRITAVVLPAIHVFSTQTVAEFYRRSTNLGLFSRKHSMAKGYWITFYRSVSNPVALAEYARLAGPPIQAGGGRFLARGTAAKTYEAGLNQRSVVIEFDSVEKAITAYESPAYQAVLKVLEGAVERDVRILEGVS